MIPVPEPKAVVETSSKFVKEFREFISRGNVVDLAVGVIMGAAFGKIVSSLVQDVIMPPIGLLMKGINFQDLYIPLNGKHYATLVAAKQDGAPTLAYGNFVNTVIEFLIVSACVFALVKAINALRRTEAAAAKPTKSEELLTEIRDLLKK
jgi:large conductance mechanosensitive channel